MASPENKRSSLDRQRSTTSADRKGAASASGPTILQFMRHADFSGNSLLPLVNTHQLNNFFSRMSRLTTLRLNQCDLENALLDGVLNMLPKLEHICLCDNGLVNLPSWETFSKLKQLHTLEVRRNRVERLEPITFEHLLKRLSVLDLSHNRIKELPDLPDVREDDASTTIESYPIALLNVSNNEITSIGPRVFVACSNIRVLDVSNNKLESIPPQIRRLQSSLRTLDVSNNPLIASQLKQISDLKQLERLSLRSTGRSARNSLSTFDGLDRLRELDISGNEFGASGSALPSAIFFLSSLKRLTLSECGLRELKLVDECPAFLASLEHLDVSRNELSALPANLGKLVALRTLLADSNQLTLSGLPPAIFSRFTTLETLSLADNQLELLPEAVCRLPKLRRLVLSSNRLVQLPDTISCLLDTLDTLELNDNPTLTAAVVPPAVQPFLLPRSIQQLGAVRKQTDGEKPAMDKASKEQSARDARFYNIDFSLNTQLRLAAERQKDVAGREQLAALAEADAAAGRRGGDSDEVQIGADPIARMRRLRKLRSELARSSASSSNAGEKDADSVLKGMRAIAGERDKVANDADASGSGAAGGSEVKNKPRWDERLRAEQPSLKYSDFFDEDIGQTLGVRMWEIDQFVPVELEADAIGQFYEEDCYLLLSTTLNRSGNLNWQIYFWLGRSAPLDKRACAAMHAVNLRNALQASNRIIRVEQGEEPNEFFGVFAEYQVEVAFFPGARTLSGFYAVQKPVHASRLYLMQVATATGDLWLECVPLNVSSLDPKYVFLLDAFDSLFVWFGERSRQLLRTKSRLFVEHLCKQERKGADCRVVMCAQSMEPVQFRRILSDPDLPADASNNAEKLKPMNVRDWLVEDWQPSRPLFYKVEMGTNAVDLRRVELLESGGFLRQSLLKSDAVYLLDCTNDLFVWIGRRSSQFLRVAAMKVATELCQYLYLEQARFSAEKSSESSPIRRHADTLLITRVLEQGEPIVFRAKFANWVDPLQPVDFTRTHDSIVRRGADLQAIVAEKLKADLSVLFTKRVAAVSHPEADRIETDLLADLDTVKSLVLDSSGRKFISLPEREFGIFYNECSYVFLCRFWVRPNADDDADGNGDAAADPDPDPESDSELDYKCIVYFWSGRHASKLGWLQFTFTMQKKLSEAFGDRLEVVRISQQREDLRFLALFKRRFIVLNGSRYTRAASAEQPTVMQLRYNNNPLTLRCIEVEPPRGILALNSAFCFLAKLPRSNSNAAGSTNGSNGCAGGEANEGSNGESQSGVCYTMYCWQGDQTSNEDRTQSRQVADTLLRYFSTHAPADESTDWSCACRVETLVDSVSDGVVEFWRAFGWAQPLPVPVTRASIFLGNSRLFRCSNESGYYCVTERCADFCQDDLNDDDVMLLDSGTAVFCWIGKRTDDTEIKLALRTAQLYVQYLKLAQPNAPRKIQVCKRGRETPEFTQCFHGWSKFREVKEWSG